MRTQLPASQVREEALGPYEYACTIGHVSMGDGLQYPLDLAVDEGQRKIHVLCRVLPRVSTWTFDGDFVRDFGRKGTAPALGTSGRRGPGDGELSSPVGIALDGRGMLHITEEGDTRLHTFSVAGEYVGRWRNDAPAGVPAGARPLGQLAGVTVDSEHNVYIASVTDHRVQKLSTDGHVLREWGRHGAGAGELDLPWGVEAHEPRGWLYVSDWRNDRLQRFDLSGRFDTTLGGSGTGPGEVRRPAGLAVDMDGNVAVADWGNDRVQVLSLDGASLAVLPGHSDRLSKAASAFLQGREDMIQARMLAGNPHPLERYFWAPTGVAFDREGTLYATDTLRHRVQVYRRSPAR